jgi:hypothetical protein
VKLLPCPQTGAFRSDFAAHGLCQLLSNHQSNARASKGVRTRFVDTIEALKDVVELLRERPIPVSLTQKATMLA